jgi:hypothetical protein
MKRHFQILFIFLLVVVSFNFFEAKFLPEGITRLMQFLFVFAAIVLAFPFSFPKWEGFVFPIHLMILSMVMSIFLSYLSWAQGFIDSIKATVPLMLWIFFFYLLKIRIPIKTIENIVLIYAGVYVLLYLFQFINSGTILFGWSTSFSTERGIKRIIFPGGGIFFLASFIALNRLTDKDTNKFVWGPLALLGLVIPVMQVTRQLIVATLFIYVLHFTRELNLIKKAFVIFVFLGLVLFIINSNHPIVQGLKKAQAETSSQGDEYIRVVAAKYFINEFSPGLINRILGNGVSYGEKSDYGKYVSKLENTKDYYLADVGFVAVYVMFGILALIAFILIWIKSFTIPVPKEYMYLKYYLWFLLMTCITSNSIYHYNYLIASVFTLYIYQRIYIREKNRGTMTAFLKKLLQKKEIVLD